MPYLLGEDSPLLLQNIPDYVIDTEPAIEAIKARLGEESRLRDRSERLFDELGKALYPSELPSQVDAELLAHRLRAFIVLDSANTKWLADYYGTGERRREYYTILTSPDRLLSNREIKLPLLRLFAEEFPMSRIIANIHADTDHKHCHVWMSARLANQLKLHMGWEDVGGVRVNRYKGLEEGYLVNYCAVVGDPQPLATHLEKKAEWNARKGLVRVALKNGERPPAMPFRERLQSRLAVAGVEVEVTRGEGVHPVPGIRLTYRGESFDALSLDGRVDVSKISNAKDSVIYQDKERRVEKCVEMAMLSRDEQDRRLSQLVNRGGRLSLEQVSNIHRTQYALLAVAAARSGATPDWANIDKQVAGMPKPKGMEMLDGEWLARTWGVGRLVELEKTGQRGAPTSVVRPMIPDRSPTRPSHDPTRDRANRPGGGGSGRSSRGGR